MAQAYWSKHKKSYEKGNRDRKSLDREGGEKSVDRWFFSLFGPIYANGEDQRPRGFTYASQNVLELRVLLKNLFCLLPVHFSDKIL